MKAPIFIRPLTENERQQIQVGLRSSDAFVLRRCQILLASARGERAITIAQQLGCDGQRVKAFTSYNIRWLCYLSVETTVRRVLRQM